MSALHAPTAIEAAADGDVERAHDGSNVGQIFLILHRVPRGRQTAAAIGATRWQWCGMTLVDAQRNRPMSFLAIRGARVATRLAGPATGLAAREWRRLSVQRPPRVIQVVLELVDLFP
jgi:hypothetical protein